MTLLHQLVDAWARRTARERRLAAAVAVLAAVLSVILIFKIAAGILDQLDREIGQLSNEVLNAAHQRALSARIESRFAEVANQHSSSWSESEIRDRLRQEIYRLSNRVPPALDATGIPVSTNSDGDLLVQVPELGVGRLLDGGEGFREYQIEFSIPPVMLTDLTAYLERLLESPQALRIERIDLYRDPERPEFTANLVITRTVVDDPAGLVNVDAGVALDPEVWRCEGCTAQLEKAGEAEPVLLLKGGDTGGKAFLNPVLPQADVFEVSLLLASDTSAQLGVSVDGAPLSTTGETALRDDGSFYRYRFQLALPAGSPGNREVALPVLTWSTPGASLRIRELRIEPVGEATHAH